jgi:hypothetical protein
LDLLYSWDAGEDRFEVRAEWTLVCLTHNLLKLYRSKLPNPAIA